MPRSANTANQNSDNYDLSQSVLLIKEERMSRIEAMKDPHYVSNYLKNNDRRGSSMISDSTIDQKRSKAQQDHLSRPYSNMSRTGMAFSRLRRSSNEYNQQQSSSNSKKQVHKDERQIMGKYHLQNLNNCVQSQSTFITQTPNKNQIVTPSQSNYKSNQYTIQDVQNNLQNNSNAFKLYQNNSISTEIQGIQNKQSLIKTGVFQSQIYNKNLAPLPKFSYNEVQNQVNKQLQKLSNRTITSIRSKSPNLIITKPILKGQQNGDSKRQTINHSQMNNYNNKQREQLLIRDDYDGIFEQKQNSDLQGIVLGGLGSNNIKSKTPQSIKQIKFKVASYDEKSQQNLDTRKTFQKVSFINKQQKEPSSQKLNEDLDEKENNQKIIPNTDEVKTKLPKNSPFIIQRNTEPIVASLNNKLQDLVSFQQPQISATDQSVELDKQQLISTNNLRQSMRSDRTSIFLQNFNNTDTAIVINNTHNSNSTYQTQQTTSSIHPLFNNNNINRDSLNSQNLLNISQNYQQNDRERFMGNLDNNNQEIEQNDILRLQYLNQSFIKLNDDSGIKLNQFPNQSINLRPKAQSVIQPKNLFTLQNQNPKFSQNSIHQPKNYHEFNKQHTQFPDQQQLEFGKHSSMKANREDLMSLNQIMQQYTNAQSSINNSGGQSINVNSLRFSQSKSKK
eukprot:403371635